MIAPAPQDLVMTLLGAYAHPRDRHIWSGGLVQLLAEFGISAGAARVALARLVARGMLARVKEGRLVHYTVTPRSAAVLTEGDGRIFSLGYKEFVAGFGPYGQTRARTRLDDREALILRTRLIHTFRQFPFIDPKLPEDSYRPGAPTGGGPAVS